ncbi:MAG: restriction endonuclease subunit S [Beijerinckiaceae bacterium]
MKGWEVKRLGEVSDFQGGSQPPKSKFISEPRPGYVRFIQIRDFKSDKHVVYIPNSKNNKICSEADIMIGRYGASVGQIHRGKAGAYNVALIKTKPNERIIDKDYFFNFLNSTLFQDPLMTVAARSAQAGFSKEDIAPFAVPLPPLPEQRRIVAILDEAFAGLATMRAHAEANLKNARALFDSHLNAIFSQRGEGCVETTLAATCSINSRLVDPREDKYLDLPHLGAGNMVSKTGEMIEIKTAREEKLISGKFLFDRDTVLYSKIRPYLMKACKPDFEGLCSADVYPLTPQPKKLDRNFLFHLLMSEEFTLYSITGSDRAGMPKVNRDHLFAYRFCLPSIEDQRNFGHTLDSLAFEAKRLESLYRAKLAAIDELKQSILNQAFTGELTKEIAPAIVTPAIKSQAANDNRQTTAMVLALAFERHKRANRDKSLGHVKAQKILHMVEAEAGFDLGRTPRRDAAGPNDFQHMLAAEEWAESAKHFSFTKIGEGYTFKPLSNFDVLTAAARKIAPTTLAQINRIIDLFIPMDMQQSEVFATVYAAWNNLVIEGKPVTDDAIIRAAREDWHPSKIAIPRTRFTDALRDLRAKGCTPTGQGRFVAASAQATLL